MNAVREGRMRVAGAIERSQTVKEQLNVQIIGLEQQMEELEQQIKEQQNEKTLFNNKIKAIKGKKEQLEIERHNAKRIEETLSVERRQIQTEIDKKEKNTIESVQTMKRCGIWQNVMMDMDSGSRK